MRERFLNLDTLRGIAAILVVWQHSSETFIRNPNIALHGTGLADFISQVDFGRTGVVCFFLISGFVIPYSFSGTENQLRGFAIRRFFRLYPAYWLSLFFAVTLVWLIQGQFLPISTIAANTTMIQGLLGFGNVQELYWTLTVELVFYCLCAQLFSRVLLHKPQVLTLLCWSAVLLFVSLQLLEKSSFPLPQLPVTVTYIPFAIAIMLCGTLIRHCHERKSHYSYASFALIMTFSIPALVMVSHLFGNSLSASPLRFSLPHLIALVIFFAVLLMPFKPWRGLIGLGTISYSIYLFHPIVMRLLNWGLQQPWGDTLSKFPLEVYLLITTLGSVALAFAVYHLLEKPSMQLGRYLSNAPIKESARVKQAG